jgi:Flp pilus assembly protein TadD
MVSSRLGAGVDLRESATGWQVISGQLEVRRRTRYSVPVHACGSVSLLCRTRSPATNPDSAAILDKALQLAATGATGATGRGFALLDEALRLDPSHWQAWEYRGQIHLGEPDGTESAFKDFTEAIRLAPDEPHLYILRSHVLTLLGQDSSARADLEAAARLGGDDNARRIPS